MTARFRALIERPYSGAVACALLVILLVGLDQLRSPDRQWTTAVALSAVDAHQAIVSPVLSRMGFVCRFEPSCSRYAEAVLARDGLLVGGWKTMTRIARCGPWTPEGTVDPP